MEETSAQKSDVLAHPGWHCRTPQTGGLTNDIHFLTGYHYSQFWRGPSFWFPDDLMVQRHMVFPCECAHAWCISPHFFPKPSPPPQSWQITVPYLWPCLPLALCSFCLQIRSQRGLELWRWAWVAHSPFNGGCLNSRCLFIFCFCDKNTLSKAVGLYFSAQFKV